MAAKPLTTEAIALTEKKMDMTLDDIIKMSKNNSIKAKKQRRPPNKSQKIFNNAVQEKALKVRQYMGSRSSVRQGVLVQRRSQFQGNHFPLASEAARKAVIAPVRNRVFNGGLVAPKMKRARFGALPIQKKAVNGGFTAKQQQDSGVSKRRPQTLDSLFANMNEQRRRVFSRQNNGVQRNGGGAGGWPRLPWARGRFGN